VIYLKSIQVYFYTGLIFVLIFGTLAHFFYEWSGSCILVGLFTPIDESTWEHMKLVFFPMLLYSIFPILKLHNCRSELASGLFTGIIVGTFLIPVLFYTYSGILGYNLLALDIATFVISVLVAFYVARKITVSGILKKYAWICTVLVAVLGICFLIFTIRKPELGIFSVNGV
jgi:hypothetical protein